VKYRVFNPSYSETFEAASAELPQARLHSDGFHVITLRRLLTFFVSEVDRTRAGFPTNKLVVFNQDLRALLFSTETGKTCRRGWCEAR
jgi:hypothetical protein